MNKITSGANLYKRSNETESGGVKYWNSPNSPNHKNSHAEVDGIEFFKFPYSPYMSNMLGEVNRVSAIIRDFMQVVKGETKQVWIANIYDHQPPFYRAEPIDRFETLNKDEVFIWAAGKLNENR